MEPRGAQRRADKEHPIERQFALSIEYRKGGIIGFSFDGVELTEDTIDAVRHDVEFVAECLRTDRASFLDEDE
jgi:hypothetical protein